MGMRRGEERGYERSLGDADGRGVLRLGRGHHGARVLHPLLEGERSVRADRIGQADPAPVEPDEARERGQTIEEAREAGLFGHGLHRDEAVGQEQKIGRPLAVGLVGDVDLSRPRVAGLRHDAPRARC